MPVQMKQAKADLTSSAMSSTDDPFPAQGNNIKALGGKLM